MHEKQTLLRFRTIDNFLVQAYLATAPDRHEDILKAPVLLQIHGLLGHFLARGTPRLLPHALLEHGFSSLSINTRLASTGQMTEKGIFGDTTKDVEAAVAYLTQEGFRNIFVLGYSLGAAMVVNWVATHIHVDVRGLILEGVEYSFPESERKKYARWGSSPSYEGIYERAKAILGADPYHSADDQTLVVYQSRGATSAPLHSEIYTYKTWWHMAGPEAHEAMAHRHITAIKLPMLMIRGEQDDQAEPWEPEALARLAQEAGHRHVRVRQIPHAGHDCMENADEMLREIVHWLSTYADSQ